MFPTFYIPADDGILDPTDVRLLWHLEGTAGTTSAPVDSSTYARSATASTGWEWDPAQKKFGTSSAFHDGVGASGPFTGTSTIFNPNGNTFTFEIWFRWGTVENGTFLTTIGYSDSERWHLATTASGTKYIRAFSRKNSVNDVVNIVSNVVPTTGRWYHIAFQQNATTSYLFIDGVPCGTGSPITLTGGTACSVRIFGQGFAGTAAMTPHGWLDELRYSHGQMLYRVSGFSPPAIQFPDP
jgi:hypothetical protein